MRITSVDNPHYRRWKRLAETPRACRESGRTLAEGLHLIEAAVAARADLQALLMADTAESDIQAFGAAAAATAGCRLIELPARLYSALSPVEHGAGLMAELGFAGRTLPERLDADAVYLDGIQDPGNAGALLRTAAAAGVRHVLASSGTTHLWAPKVLRAAMGAHFVISIHEDVEPARLAGACTGERLAADAVDGESLYTARWGAGATVWMFGSEGAGLSAAARSIAQRRLRIPIDAGVESLNVAAAAAVCLFEQRRRRG